MSRIKGKNTSPEIIVRKYLFSKHFRYFLHSPEFPGKPDIILPKYRALIFVNGCFWHGHEGCKRAELPKTNIDFWEKKIKNNILRDKKNMTLLKQDGWKAIIVWECEIKNKKIRELRLNQLINQITTPDTKNNQ